jgi:hypothetical protein
MAPHRTSGTAAMALRIGELLLQRGLISRDQLEHALTAQRRWGTRLGMSLVRLGFIEESALTAALTEQLGIPAAPAAALDRIPPEIITRVPAQVARKHKIVPVGIKDDAVHVCLADPQNLLRMDDIAFTLGCAIRPFLATERLIDQALEQYYPVAAATQPAIAPPVAESAAAAGSLSTEAATSPPAEAAEPVPAVALRDDPSRKQQALQALARALEAVRKEAAAVQQEETIDRELIELPEGELERRERVTVAERPAAASLTSYGRLAAVTSRAEVAAAVTATFCDFFPTFCLLEIEGGTARCVGMRLGGAPPSDGAALARLPFVEADWSREALARSRLAVTGEVKDPHLVLLLDRLALPTRGVVVAPVPGDGGTLYYVALCLGVGEPELKPIASKLRPYLLAVADAVRMIALRDQIIRRGRSDAPDRVVSDETSSRHLDFSGTATDPALRQTLAANALPAKARRG